MSQSPGIHPRTPDKRTKHDASSYTGMAAEHHEADAPALLSDEDAERQQQCASAGNAKDVGRGDCRDLPKTSRCWRCVAKANAAKPARHSAKTRGESFRSLAGGDGDRSLPVRLAHGPRDGSMPGRAYRQDRVENASAQHMISMPANTQSPSTKLRHSGRCVVSALRTGNRNSSAEAAHNCSTQADLRRTQQGMQQR